MTSLRHFKWKTLAILAAVLAVGVIGLWLFIGKLRERKVFVSKVVSGYRYHCTLSTDWQRVQDASSATPDKPESYLFSASPSPIREWIATHLFHQQPATGNVFNGRPQLILGTEARTDVPYFLKIEAGYPEPDLHDAEGPGMKVLTNRHFRRDGCPASVTAIEEISSLGKKTHATLLFVCTPDYAITYFVESAAEPEYSDQADREMQAIVSSFHVKKVAMSVGNKR